MLHPPAHRLGAGIARVEVAEAFVAEARTLPHAERCIDDDRRGSHAVLERGHVNQRLERRSRLAECLRRAIVGRSDNIETALHRHAYDPYALLPPGKRRQSRGSNGEHSYRRRSTSTITTIPGLSALNAVPPPPRRDCCAAEADKFPSLPSEKPSLALLPDLLQHDRLAPVGEARSKRSGRQLPAPILVQIDRQLRVLPTATAVELCEAFAKRIGSSILHQRYHRSSHPQSSGIDAVGPLLGLFPEAADQVCGGPPP